MLKVYLAGRAAEQIVFGRVTNGAANDLERATALARSMVFEYGMADSRQLAHDAGRQLRALRGDEAPARRGAGAPHRRRLRRGAAAAGQAPAPLDRIAHALLERETLDREELDTLLADLPAESRASDLVGTIRVISRND